MDKSDYAFLAASFAGEGALVIVPNHDLCPGVGIDRIAMQLTEAVAWAWRHAAAHGGDPSRIALVGHSAGGHLAAMLSCCDWKRVPPPAPQTLYAVVGAQESEEFRRQNRLIRQAWGARAVPVCEELPGCNHFTVLHDLADSQGRAHQLARRLLGLRGYGGAL